MSEIEGLRCIGFQKEYASINSKMEKDTPILYDYAILNLYILETGRGFKVKKILKTTSKGTKVNYEAITSKEDADKYKELIKDKVKEFNDKWNANLKVDNEDK